MKRMEQHEKYGNPSLLPLLPRLDRLDRLVHLLEERHKLSERERRSCGPILSKKQSDEDEEYKTLSLALQEVDRKGTLLDRLTMLENRVLQLSLEMDLENTSRSSSTTLGKTVRDVEAATSEKQEDGAFETQLHKGSNNKRKAVSIMRLRKWLCIFRIGC